MQDADDLVPEDAGQRAALTKALAGLPDDQRAIVELILAGRGEADVATTLNLPRSQVAAMMTAAMRAIRERLTGPPSGGSLPAIVALLALTSG